MATTICPKCHKANVAERYSKRTSRPYFANVEVYPNGAAYFRSLHTREECEAYAASIVAEAAAERAFEEAMTAWSEEGKRIDAAARERIAAGEPFEAIRAEILAHSDKMPTRG